MPMQFLLYSQGLYFGTSVLLDLFTLVGTISLYYTLLPIIERFAGSLVEPSIDEKILFEIIIRSCGRFAINAKGGKSLLQIVLMVPS